MVSRAEVGSEGRNSIRIMPSGSPPPPPPPFLSFRRGFWAPATPSRRWRVAKPDEWLLVLREGKLLGQGIGLRAFCGRLGRHRLVLAWPKFDMRIPKMLPGCCPFGMAKKKKTAEGSGDLQDFVVFLLVCQQQRPPKEGESPIWRVGIQRRMAASFFQLDACKFARAARLIPSRIGWGEVSSHKTGLLPSMQVSQHGPFFQVGIFPREQK